MEVRELGRKVKNTMPAAEKEKLVKQMRTDDDKMVHGKFEFIDAQGGWFEFAYRKYPGELIKMIKLIHDEVCDLPMGIVRHLNNTVRKVRKYKLEMSPEGQAKTARPYTAQSRVRFIPMDMF
jgi:hypothetical protein